MTPAEALARKIAERWFAAEDGMAELTRLAAAFVEVVEAAKKNMDTRLKFSNGYPHELICNWQKDGGESPYCNCGWNDLRAALAHARKVMEASS